ncbi:MAG: DUF1549 and DUF1553 domain-containing protein [Planctomycetes bacterium]|nr:DUF1549 and DUF1553 domain-containing protein [Planctomycetota bacterium]
MGITIAFASVASAEDRPAPATIDVFPPAVRFDGPREQMQLVITTNYADDRQADATRSASFASSDPGVAVVENGVVLPRGDGKAEIAVEVGGLTTTVAVEVENYSRPAPVSFYHGALAAITKQGCNAGACHGSPSGKGGFRMSLRAFDPELDKFTLIREEYGRRTNVHDPDSSLLLLKPMMKVPHGGGLKLTKGDPAFTLLRDWIAEGCRLDPPEAPKCVRIEVFPGSGRVYKIDDATKDANQQQLCVLAHFSDGSVRDVTPLAVYSSSDEQVAEVAVGGLVTGKDRGEAAIMVRYMEFIESVYVTFVRDIEGFAWSDPPSNNYIDDHVYAKLKQLKFLPSELCADEEFIRRVYLDTIGVLPTIEETQAFLSDSAPDKRSKLIDGLLERPEYARFWALKWGDLLRMTKKAVGDAGVHKYHQWLLRSFQENAPYDEFAREVLTASGSTHVNPAANFYRTATDVNDTVESIAQVFLGARLQCAKCHNHPFERWTQDNYYGMAAFFNRVQRKSASRPDEMFVYAARSGEITQPRTGETMKPWAPEAGEMDVPADADRRDPFAHWLTEKDNPFFARVEANRIWAHLFGRGIVDPPDDFRDSNPPSNAALLDALAKDFAEYRFDRKHLLRTILNSRTYQASSRPNEFNDEDKKFFSHYQPRLLSAEQLLDAICHVTGVAEKFGSLPASVKATQLPSPDLADNEFLKVFGQPERQTVCECERSDDSNLGQALQLFNGPLVHGKLRDANNRFRRLISENKPDDEVIRTLYLAALCREPSEGELEASLSHVAAKPDNRIEALDDVCWAILNTHEFLFQH